MNKTKRGLKVAAMLLSLLLIGVVADSGNLYGQSQTTYNDFPAVMEHGSSAIEQGSGLMEQGSVVTEHGSACSSCNAPAAVAYAQPAPAYTAPVASCGCNSGRKRGCKSCFRKKTSCPNCDCQFCELEVKKGEVEKSSYKVEQKEVCIPAVRLPWKKNCPPKRSRVRTVNVLKKEKYKCPKCEYKWSVHEPEEYKEPEAAEPVAADKPEQNVAEAASSYPDPVAETTGDLKLSDPAGALEDVPRPPLEK